MHWVDKIASQIIDSKQYRPYWVDDMKTPSGRIHVGSLRGVVIHDLIFKGLTSAGQKTKFTYVFDDSDPMDEVSSTLDKNLWGKYLGQPLFTVPSPDKSAVSYAEYFAKEFIEVFNKIGCQPEILWTSQLYREGKMNAGVKTCLDQADKIRKIYEETYHKEVAKDWFPFNVVCPQCGKESTTKVTGWDGKEVSFTCEKDAVAWTKGCGHQGKMSPFSNHGQFAGKLPWKVEWPVKWQAIGVTVEGAGKDHMSAGGSHDIAKVICQRVLKYPVPFPVGYEFFLIGGKKMSSSKGLGSSAKDVSDILPPELLRFLFVRTDYREAINFDPSGTLVVPDLFDEYDRAWKAFVEGKDENLIRTFNLSQVEKGNLGKEKLFLPRFRDVAQYLQFPDVDLPVKFTQIKGEKLTVQEMKILSQREAYAKIWLRDYAPSEFKIQMLEEIPPATKELTSQQKDFLSKLIPVVQEEEDPEKLQVTLYNLSREIKISPAKAFEAIYLIFLGSNHGPRAAWFLLQYPKEKVIKRLRLASQSLGESPKQSGIKAINKPEFFTIDSKVKEKFSSVSVGVALIKGVTVTKSNPGLEIEKDNLLKELGGLTTEQIGKYSQVESYRLLYKAMGVDWHSRRPSPEALLRRVALGKGLYTINTCVDAYNLIVMKHRVSVGAFDAEKISFPTNLRVAGEGDEILLLGDEQGTKYTAKELAYYDQKGGYNIDFNYRDAQRTAVTEKTKDLWINVDGIFDITPEAVEKSLGESIKLIQKYCGGKLEFAGVVL